MPIWTFLIGLPWKKIGKVMIRYWYLVAILALAITAWHRGNVIDARDKTIEAKQAEIKDLNRKITGYTAAIDTLDGVLKINRDAIAVCKQINDDNAIAAERMQQNVKSAVDEIAALKRAGAIRQEQLKRESKKFDNDLECPAYTVDYRQFLLDSTRSTDPHP